MNKYTLENTDTVLVNVHPACETQCAVHNKTDHTMRSFPQWFRSDTGLMERTCPHGVGHPDPDSLPYFERMGVEGMDIHGCDGCCR